MKGGTFVFHALLLQIACNKTFIFYCYIYASSVHIFLYYFYFHLCKMFLFNHDGGFIFCDDEKSTKSTLLENEYFGPQNDSYLIIHPYSCFVSSLFDWISICRRFQWWSKQMFQTLLLAIAIIRVPLAKKE